MPIHRIYRKTPKGTQEVASRSLPLPARERSLLIMFDGTTPADVLMGGNAFTDAEKYLEHLLNEGLIEMVGAAEPPPATNTQSVEVVKRFATHFLLDTFGPDADSMTLKLEQCTEADELQLLLGKYRDLVKSAFGEKKAEAFAAGCAPLL